VTLCLHDELVESFHLGELTECKMPAQVFHFLMGLVLCHRIVVCGIKGSLY